MLEDAYQPAPLSGVKLNLIASRLPQTGIERSLTYTMEITLDLACSVKLRSSICTLDQSMTTNAFSLQSVCFRPSYASKKNYASQVAEVSLKEHEGREVQ